VGLIRDPVFLNSLYKASLLFNAELSSKENVMEIQLYDEMTPAGKNAFNNSDTATSIAAHTMQLNILAFIDHVLHGSKTGVASWITILRENATKFK
jgi:hypothetical protein